MLVEAFDNENESEDQDEAALGMVSSTGIDICNKVLLNDPISELVFNKFEVHEGSIEDKKRAI